MSQKIVSSRTRNPRNRRESRFRRRDTRFATEALCVDRPVSVSDLRATIRQSLQPERRVSWVGGADETDAEIHQCHADSANRGGSQRAVVQILALDEDVGKSSDLAHATDLRPEGAADHSCVKAPYGFPFHDLPVADLVVTDPQPASFDRDPQLDQAARDASGRLAGIDDDPGHRDPRVADRSSRMCRIGVPLQMQLALSRREGA